MPKVMAERETIAEVLRGRSMARVGEGELKLAIAGMDLKSQRYDARLADEIKAVLTTPGPAMACLPRNYKGMPNEPFWRKFEAPRYAAHYRLPVYGSAFVTRPDMVNDIDAPGYWALVRQLWERRDVVLASHGRKVLPMPEAASVKFVACPPVGAYAEIDRIAEEIGRPQGPVFLALGATATVLAARLAAEGVWAIDIGHLGHFLPHAGAYAVDREKLISPDYAASQRAMHARPEGYGGSGRKQAETVMAFAREIKPQWILDYGCGQGTLKAAMVKAGYLGSIHEYDPAIQGKALLPKPADLVVSTDVLEHVEPDKLGAVLDHIFGLAKKAVFLLIATRPANKTLPDKRNAHLIVQPAEWWEEQMRNRGFSVTRREVKIGHDVKLWMTRDQKIT
jgi:hypothetical protein